MSSNQNTINETSNQQPNNIININLDHSPDSNNINSSLIPNNDISKAPKTPQQSQIYKNENRALEEKKYQSNAAPFKSLINVKNQIIRESNTLNNNSFLGISSNPFSNKKQSEIIQNAYVMNELNQKTINENNIIQNDIKNNKSQYIRNSINVVPKKLTEFSNEINNSIIRIKVYKSHVKPHLSNKNDECVKKINVNINNKENINNNCNITDFNEKKLKYKLLIKRIALQLKRKTRPSTKGYFYVSIVRTDKYMNRIKKIAKKMKNQTNAPTHGFFYSFLEKENNEKKYKILIKRIASQLKKRIAFPKCKIIKIYQSYRLLIKRIADSLKKSLIKKEKTVPTTMEDNKNVNENNCANQDVDNKMDIDIDVNIDNKEVKIEDVAIKDDISNEKKDSVSPINNITNVINNANENEVNQNIVSNNSSNYTFSKISVQEEVPKSAELNKKINLMNDNNNNLNKNLNNINGTEIKNEKIEYKQDMSAVPLNINSNFFDKDLNQETFIEKKEENIQLVETSKEQNKNNDILEEKDVEMKSEENSKKEDNINNNIKNEAERKDLNSNSISIKSVSSSTKQNKTIYFNMPFFTKENLLEENEQMKGFNKSHSKNDINSYFNNLNNNNNNNDNKNEKNINDHLSLTEIKETKPNFIQKFQHFLEQEKIEIKDNFPVSLNEKYKIYLQQSNFWYLIICYILYLSNNLSLYSIIHLLEQYNIWTKEKNEEIFYSLKEKIIEYINNNYSNEIIKQFLFMNKFKDINQIFEKFEISNGKNGKKYKEYEYKEIKVDNINFINCDQNLKCKCDLCTSDEACIKKVSDLNKNKIHIVNDSSINYNQLTPEEMKQNMIQKINENNIFHNNEALFYKGISKKKQNYIFSKSKTIFEENTNIEYIYIPKENIEMKSINTNDINNNKNNDDENTHSNGITKEKGTENTEISNEVIPEEKATIIDNDERKKNFKNISKMKTYNNQEKNVIESDKKDDIEMKCEQKEEEKESKKNKEKDEKEEDNSKEEDNKNKEKEKEEEDIDDEDNKSNKKEKKSRKGKSRNKNRKKKEITKIKNENIINEKDNEIDKDKNKEDNENDEKEEEKSYKKKRKLGSNNIKKKNKSKFVDKEGDGDEERDELEEMLKEDGIENKNEDENVNENNSNSIRKKKKSPNKKKNKKH